MAEIICGIYIIINIVTNDFYIGSSKDVKLRWAAHKRPSVWKKYPNNLMYQDMERYGTDKFVFEVLEVVEPCSLKEAEQQFIEVLQPTYNSNRANGLDVERQKESQKKYHKSVKFKESQNKYHKSVKFKESQKKYNNQLCFYNCETLTLSALRQRLKSQGFDHPTEEAKKYLL